MFQIYHIDKLCNNILGDVHILDEKVVKYFQIPQGLLWAN